MTESENKAITIMNNAKKLSGDTQQKVRILRTRKKDSADQFLKQKQKLEAEFSRSVSDPERLQGIYQSTLKEAGKLKEKLDDVTKKNKGSKMIIKSFIVVLKLTEK